MPFFIGLLLTLLFVWSVFFGCTFVQWARDRSLPTGLRITSAGLSAACWGAATAIASFAWFV